MFILDVGQIISVGMSPEIAEGYKKIQAAYLYPISAGIDHARETNAKKSEKLRRPYIRPIDKGIKGIDKSLVEKRKELRSHKPGTDGYNNVVKEIERLQKSKQTAEQSKQTAGLEDKKVQQVEEDNATMRAVQLEIDRYGLPLLDGTLAQRSVEGTAARNSLLDQRHRATFVAGGELFAAGGIGAGEH